METIPSIVETTATASQTYVSDPIMQLVAEQQTTNMYLYLLMLVGGLILWGVLWYKLLTKGV